MDKYAIYNNIIIFYGHYKKQFPSGLEVMMYLLHIDLNVFLQAVAVQVQDQIMDKIKAVTHNDQRQLVGQLGFLLRKI